LEGGMGGGDFEKGWGRVGGAVSVGFCGPGGEGPEQG